MYANNFLNLFHSNTTSSAAYNQSTKNTIITPYSNVSSNSTAMIYVTKFEENGLPTGTNWSVEYSNLSSFSNQNDIIFNNSNGTSAFSVGSTSEIFGYCDIIYYPVPQTGNLTSGATQLINFTYSEKCNIPPIINGSSGAITNTTFIESGLPSNIGWSVTYNSVTESANPNIISVGTTPTRVAISPNGEYAYVTDWGFGISAVSEVSVINISMNKVIANISAGSMPISVAITPNGQYAYVAVTSDKIVSVIDTSTNTVTATIPLSEEPYGAIAITPNGQYAYVADGNQVSVINIPTNTIIANISTGSPMGIAITPNGQYTYVTNPNNDRISVINTSTNTVMATITAIGNWPKDIAITPNGEYAYVTNQKNNTVSVISTSTNTVIANISVGNDPYSVAVTPNGQYAYVTNNGDNTVSIINTLTNTVTATLPVGNEPWGIAIAPNGENAYVVNYGSNTVSVISTSVMNSGIIFSTYPGSYSYSVSSLSNSSGSCTTSYLASPSSGSLAAGSTQVIDFTPSTSCI
jgi:YVTN family beta-propeller protein